MTSTAVGVLALQGDFEAHAQALRTQGARVILVKRREQLAGISGLVLPGGESSTMLKLLDEDFIAALQHAIERGMPTLATCAGMILLARQVSGPAQASLGMLDIDVQRNAYGRQLNSFVDTELPLTETGKKCFPEHDSLEGVFIRAPKITRAGDGVEVLATCGDDPVLVKSESILAASFHPELKQEASPIHQYFVTTLAELTES